jgi:hypothetical protein
MAHVTSLFPDPFAARTPGGSMTMPTRKLPFMHIGGPADGSRVPVVVDNEGVPVDFYTLADYTAPDYGVDPTAGLASNLLQALYERDEILGDEGFEYVYRFAGQQVIEARKAA